LKSVLVITHCAPEGLPQQGSLVAEKLRQSGSRIRVLGCAKSGWGRLLEITSYGLLLIPRYDVVLVDVFGHRAFVYESIGILWAHVTKRRAVVVLRNGRLREFIQRWQPWSGLVLSLPTEVLVPHEFLREQLSEIGLRVDGMIPNCIDLDNYKFKERSTLTPRFLYLRGTHPYYNAPMAVQVFALIQRKYPEAELTMAGKEDTDLEQCRSLIDKMKLRNVNLLGLVPKTKIPSLADKHDIYIQTNRVDNMPVSVIEMWACGLPIVATNVGGVPYMVKNGDDGILVASGDCQAMADACIELLVNSDLARKLSINGRARAMELTWDHVRPMWQKTLFADALSLK
jgi:glycosyltransferase involved in cell wall biosynthesis